MVTMATCLLIYNCYVVMVTVTMAMLLGNIHTVVYDDGVRYCYYGNVAMVMVTMVVLFGFILVAAVVILL